MPNFCLEWIVTKNLANSLVCRLHGAAKRASPRRLKTGDQDRARRHAAVSAIAPPGPLWFAWLPVRSHLVNRQSIPCTGRILRILANHPAGLNVHDGPALEDLLAAPVAMPSDLFHGCPSPCLAFSAFH